MSTSTKSPAMKSVKNLTRFTYETAAFQGWRLCLAAKGTQFVRYFPDGKFGNDGKKSFEAASNALGELKRSLKIGRLIDGKLSPSTIRRCNSLLKAAVPTK